LSCVPSPFPLPIFPLENARTHTTVHHHSQVAVGGGSTIGLGKALALHSPDSSKIRQIVIPTTCTSPVLPLPMSSLPPRLSLDCLLLQATLLTTFHPLPYSDAGSEATPIIGQTENDKDGNPLKTTQKTNKVRLLSVLSACCFAFVQPS
jgi:hypothetical protein